MVGRLVSGWMVGFLVGWWLNGVGLLVGRLAGGSMVGEVRPRGGGWVEDRHLDRISLSATSADRFKWILAQNVFFPTKHKNPNANKLADQLSIYDNT